MFPSFACVLSLVDVLLIFLNDSSTDAMGGVLEGINQDNSKYDTSLNTCKSSPSLEEVGNISDASGLESGNSRNECKHNITIETEDSNDGNVKPSSPSDM